MIRTELERAWARSDQLLGMLEPSSWQTRGIPLRHPVVFYVGHLPAFAWAHIGVGVAGRGPLDPNLDGIFERGIDVTDAAAAMAAAPAVWPAPAEILAYRDAAREAVRDVLPEVEARRDDPMARWVGPMVLEHELMHHETLLYLLSRLDVDDLIRPTDWDDPAEGEGSRPQHLPIAAGEVRIGKDRSGAFGWCNEFPQRRVQVDAFGIDDLPVQVGAFEPFVAAGGYDERRWWTEVDWTWIQRARVRHPDNWRPRGKGWEVRSLFRWHALDDVSGWPVQVSLAEARAWTRWAGRRLPTEAELHRAARTEPGGGERAYPWGDAAPDHTRGAFDFNVRGPVPVGRFPAGTSAWGAQELVGNGWEWSRTPFVSWEGFEAHLSTYPGYSADFFDGEHYVVYGASWCTAARLLRPTFRNWYQPHYPYVFATFRPASDLR